MKYETEDGGMMKSTKRKKNIDFKKKKHVFDEEATLKNKPIKTKKLHEKYVDDLQNSKLFSEKKPKIKQEKNTSNEEMPKQNVLSNKKRKHSSNSEGMPQKSFSHLKKNKDRTFNNKVDGVQNSETNPKKKFNKRKSEDGETSPSKKQKLHQMKFKERKQMRKKMDKKFDVVSTLKKYWEDLRREDCSAEKKSELLKQIYNLMKGRAKEFAFAHDTVRVLECMMSEGTEHYRTLLFEELKDDIILLTKSKYGKFFVLKVLRYGTKKQKEFVVNAFQGIVPELMKHTEAAEVVETAFNEYTNASQRLQMIQEFYGSSFRHFKEPNIHNLTELLQQKPESKSLILQSMKEELMKVLGKSVVKHSLIHHVLLQFFLNCDPASRSEIIESLREVVPEILHTKDGSRVAMHCVWHGDHKDRKAIIKHMKTFVKKIAMEEHGHMVLLAIFDCVDDTTLIDKIIIKELQENLLEVSQNIHGKKVLIYLLNPRDSHFFHPDVINILKAGDDNLHSKKDPEKRREELKTAIANPLTELIVNNIADLYKDNSFCLFTVTILRHTVGDRRQAFQAIAKLASEAYTSENKNIHVVESGGSFFMLKQLILNDTAEIKEGKNLHPVSFSEVLVNTVPDGVMKTWFRCNRGAFLLISLLETEIPAVINRVKNELMGCHKQLDKLNFRGAEILVKKLRKLSVNTSSE